MADGVVEFDFDHTATFIDAMNSGLSHLCSKVFTFRTMARSGVQFRLYARRKSPFRDAETILICREVSEFSLTRLDSFDCSWSEQELAVVDALKAQGHSILPMFIVIRRGPSMAFFLEENELSQESVCVQELLCRMMSDHDAARALASNLVY
ncbi:hypothetical protein [Pseudoalteromonas sp. T1lg23B]|uniref:hypothetical protein n=1 Tax=Pseudoalteromonas sp. T1lg23B TaxID=2077097 RepID=UPI000CF66153|nr:hypothetical protein [Pseudoalteromonas sp. T1lg23B]